MVLIRLWVCKVLIHKGMMLSSERDERQDQTTNEKETEGERSKVSIRDIVTDAHTYVTHVCIK